MAERVRVCLAGQPGLEVGGSVESVAAALGPLGTLALAFLVSERHRPVSRHELAELLWGDDLPATWEPSLRSVISRVRRRLEAAGLGTGTIVGGGGCYRLELPVDVSVDVEEAGASLGDASAALAGCDWERARKLAAEVAEVAGRGFLPGAAGLWVERRSAELEELRLRALEVVADAASGAGDHAAASSAAEAIVNAQPLRESAYVRLMNASAAGGDRGAALRAYERCRQALAEDLGVSPSERTEAAYLALLAGEETTPGAAPPTNLSAELSSFVGRMEEVREVEKLLGASRLLTLVGPGGVGKTRLANRVGAAVVGRYPDGVWIVELAALADPALLADAVLSALVLPEVRAATPQQSLRQGLAGRRLLLILDNCEHLAAAAAALVRDLLGGCEGLRVVATSRTPLGVPGEALWPVPPLSLPGEGDEAPEQLADSEAVRLFVERASEADPGFSLTPANATDVAEICRQLDGLPLALELAAARTRSMSVAEVATRLRDRFRLLVGRDPTAPDRHRTLRAAVDWSYEALSPGEQVLFRRLSVFAGGFGLEAAEAVCDGLPSGLDVLDGVAALVDQSLVVSDRARAVTRYRLLETLRHYATEQLAASGEESAVRNRHLGWVCDLAERAEGSLDGKEQAVWIQVVAADEDNIRAALDWAVTHRGSDEGLRAAAALWRYWQVRSRYEEGRRWLRSLLASTPDASPDVRAKALMSDAILLIILNEHAPLSTEDAEAARASYEESLAIRRATGNRRGVAAALNGLGGLYFRTSEAARARACFEETLDIGRELGDKRLMAASLTNLAILTWMSPLSVGKDPALADARALYEQSIVLLRELGDHFATARALTDLSAIVLGQDDYDTARALLVETMAIQRQIDDRRGLAGTINGLARLAQRQSDHATARSLLEESIALSRELRNPFEEAVTLIRLASVSWSEGRTGEARRLFQEAAAAGRGIELKGPLYDALDSLGILAVLEDDLPAARRLFDEAEALTHEAHDLESDSPWRFSMLAALALAEGRAGEAADHCRTAFGLCGVPKWRRPPPPALDVAAVLVADAHPDWFARLVGVGDGFRNPGNLAPLQSRPEFQRALESVKDRLGEDAYQSAHARGAAMSVEEGLAFARSVVAADMPDPR